MKNYVVKNPFFISYLFPKRIWHFSRKQKTVYLTFDDGPIPDVTPWVLQQLKQYNAKATFFCIGHNIQKHPALFAQLKAEGHQLGNHTFNHLNASKTSFDEYMENTKKAEVYFKQPLLFRPPYGKLDSKKAKALINSEYQIVMWDVLSADFDQSISPEICLKNVLSNATNGSIVIFHDSLKAEKNLRYALPEVLRHFSEKGFVFKAI
ncbi:polysaccharide deacetylase family protein [Planktosalinus lacus]|uniref:Polysaccharide deacetylase n=1 Tax=Planktosalinus lacus TaxID=1526573 RepID=A0A8J2Y8G6_9FLAO|nr:polysaccharide deacetylase family protein [Planktosalinus lacus]GGD82850.1 polysaccharide deacetylase [Planktosalinus lacus]